MPIPPRPFPPPPCPPPPGASDDEKAKYVLRDYEHTRRYMGRQPRPPKEAPGQRPALKDRSFPLPCRLFGHKDKYQDMFCVPMEGFPALWFDELRCARCDTTYVRENGLYIPGDSAAIYGNRGPET